MLKFDVLIKLKVLKRWDEFLFVISLGKRYGHWTWHMILIDYDMDTQVLSGEYN